MARPLIYAPGLRALQRDLKAIGAGGDVQVRNTIRKSMIPMLAVAKRQAMKRAQTGELADNWRAVVRGASGALINRLPQSSPLEFGQTIAPKGTPISLAPRTDMVYGPDGAIQKGKPITERLLADNFDHLFRSNGFGS